MALITLAIVMAVPLQLAGAAAIETTGGFDSTVQNPRATAPPGMGGCAAGTPCPLFGPGGIARLGLDLQLGHQSDTVRQILRNRTDFVYTGGEGRSIGDSDIVDLARYALLWEPSDTFNTAVDLQYSIGRSSALLGRAGSNDLSFQPGVYSDVVGRIEFNKALGETWRTTLEFGPNWRYALSLPPLQARNNTFGVHESLAFAHDFSDDDVGQITVRHEYFDVDGFPNPVNRLTGFLGYTRSWNDNFTTAVAGGVDTIQDQNNTARFNVGPYVTAGMTFLFPDVHFSLGLNYRREFTIVSGSRCAAGGGTTSGLLANGQCPANRVVGGGTGTVDSATLQAIWQSEEAAWTISGDVGLEHGVTENITLSSTTPTCNATNASGCPRGLTTNLNVVATAGVRYEFSRAVSMFVRYDFLYQNVAIDDVMSAMATTGTVNGQNLGFQPEIIRHVGLLGFQFAIVGGDGPLEGIRPLEEISAVQGARSASAGANSENNAPVTNNGPADDTGFGADPFDLQNDPATTNARAPNAVGTTPAATGNDDNDNNDSNDDNDSSNDQQGEQHR